MGNVNLLDSKSEEPATNSSVEQRCVQAHGVAGRSGALQQHE